MIALISNGYNRLSRLLPYDINNSNIDSDEVSWDKY